MAYGRVNILGQSETKNYKGLDSVGGAIDGHYIEYIDFSRQRKVTNHYGRDKTRILDFNNNIIGEYEGRATSLHPAGLVKISDFEGYYDIKTGKQSDLPKLYEGHYINLEGDYIRYDKPYIYNKNDSVRFNLKFKYGKNIKHYVTGDAYYFYNIYKEGFVLYKYKDRKLNIIKEVILPKDIVDNLSAGDKENSLEFMDRNIIYLA